MMQRRARHLIERHRHVATDWREFEDRDLLWHRPAEWREHDRLRKHHDRKKRRSISRGVHSCRAFRHKLDRHIR